MMEPEVTRELFVTVETVKGATSRFPADAIGWHTRTAVVYPGRKSWHMACAAVDGMWEAWGRDDSPKRILIRETWAARWQMPGYLDATEWTTGDTQAEVVQALADETDDCAQLDALSQFQGAPDFDPCDDSACPHCHDDCDDSCEVCFETRWYVDGGDEPDTSAETEAEARFIVASILREWRNEARDWGGDDPRSVTKVPKSWPGGGWEYVRPDRADNLRLSIRSERTAR